MSDLPVAATEEAARVAQVRSAHPTAVLRDLTLWAIGRGEELAGLAVARPSLEDV